MPTDAEARLVLKGVDDATPTIQKTKSEMDSLDDSVQGMTSSTAEANLNFMAMQSALSGLSGGFDQMTTSMIGLNWVTEEQGRLLQQCGYFMKIFVGAGQMITGVIALVNALKTSETALAVVEAFRTALIPGFGIVLVGIAAAAAALIGAKLAGWYQTNPWETRTVRETGPAMVHKGETISRSSSSKEVHVHIEGGRGHSTLLDDYKLAKRIGKEVARAG